MNVFDAIAASGDTGVVLIALVLVVWMVPVRCRDDHLADDR